MKVAVIILCVLALLFGAGAYYFYSQASKATAEFDRLNGANKELAFQISKLEEEKASIVQELEQKISDISRSKEEEVAKVKGTYDELVEGMKQEIEDGKIKITRLADRLSVSMVDKILFPSGEAEVTPEGVKVLERVGKVLKNTTNKVIRVEGHTDNVPISSKLIKKYPTNWELSNARATNVVRFLQEKVGIESARLEAVGLAEFHPIASNETVEGRSQNRRIEIILLPDIKDVKVEK
ncbi:MAG TPA: OmpA family protein [bacterium]|nr:OmpA family protein [bacterium]HPN43414.1 OmpA family protein [bacterium]